jgi:hypothetical protein
MNDPAKPYELTFENRPDYLYAKIKSETITREIALRYLREVAARCTEVQCRRLLLERDIPVMLAGGDLFFTTNDFLNMIKNVRVAFVNPHATIESQMEFAILVGTNRGARFSLHPTVDEAETWLLGRPAD